MSEIRDLFRCDYCGQLADVDNAVTYWTEVESLDDVRRLYTPATYCSPYCGRTASSRFGTGRG